MRHKSGEEHNIKVTALGWAKGRVISEVQGIKFLAFILRGKESHCRAIRRELCFDSHL